MKPHRASFLSIQTAVALLLGVLAAGNAAAQAADARALLTQANAALRQAEKDMFAGEADKAVAALDGIKQSLARAAATDPASPGVKAAERKYATLVKDLERRTGRNLGAGTVTATAPAAPAAEPAAPPAEPRRPAAGAAAGDEAPKPAADAKVPYAARKPLLDVTQRLTALDRNLADLADPAYRGDRDQLVQRAEEKLTEIRGLLAEVKKLAPEAASHPDVQKAEAALAAAAEKVAAGRSGHEKNKAELAAKAREVEADVAALKAELDRLQPLFDAANGAVPHYNDPKPVNDLLARIDAFEKQEAPAVARKLEAFAAKYGSTREEIDRKAGEAGYAGEERASYLYASLAERLANVRKTRAAMAESLIAKALGEIARLRNAHDFAVADRLAEIRGCAAMAAGFQPDNPKVRQAAADLEPKIAEALKDFYARIDKREWPGHAATAPSNAKSLARTALDWFRSSPDWGANAKKPSVPLAVVVTGPWSIQQRNILGEPTMYGLPVLLAVQQEGDKALNVARVFSLTMRTAEKAGAKMEPPFDHVTVGDSQFIRPAAIR